MALHTSVGSTEARKGRPPRTARIDHRRAREVTSHLVDWISGSIDEGPAGPTDGPSHSDASYDARQGRNRLGDGRCGGAATKEEYR